MYLLADPTKKQNKQDQEKIIKVQFDASSLKYPLLILLIILALVGSSVGYYFYKDYSKNADSSTLGVQIASDQKEFTEEEIEKIVAKVAQITVLPQDELPQVGTVNDPISLKNQPFFENAKTGDLILIYKQARKVFLYNPQSHKIVNIGPYSEPTEATVSAKPATGSSSPNPKNREQLKEVDATITPTPSSTP